MRDAGKKSFGNLTGSEGILMQLISGFFTKCFFHAKPQSLTAKHAKVILLVSFSSQK